MEFKIRLAIKQNLNYPGHLSTENTHSTHSHLNKIKAHKGRISGQNGLGY